jgi:hypothetical protein
MISISIIISPILKNIIIPFGNQGGESEVDIIMV